MAVVSKPARGIWTAAAAGTALKRRATVQVRSLARSKTKAAIKTLVEIMLDENAPALSRVAAAKAILDRGWGAPVVPLANEDGKPLELVHRIERIIVHRGAAEGLLGIEATSATSELIDLSQEHP